MSAKKSKKKYATANPDSVVRESRRLWYLRGDPFHKDVFHEVGPELLRALAAELGLPKGSYDVRSNQAGPALLGEITLHGEWAYVLLGGTDFGVLYRRVSGRLDSTGGPNHWLPWDRLTTAALADAVRGLAPQTGEQAEEGKTAP